ncbi:MAG: glycosyltransferase family 2 protein [Desulfobacterales bacterium]|nr:glycosyltransferase family 2 protein [Desulfobacterales bacterium]
MYKDKKIGVVVPAYNEELMIRKTLETMPEFVDMIIVVDDRSLDRTSKVVKECRMTDGRVVLIRHDENQGVGGTIVTGYKKAIEEGIDVAAVMAGDAQMDPDDLIRVIEPVANGEVDYTKGNRLFRGESWELIPHYRYIGNSFLSLLTKIASGYWHIADFQCGYTAVSLTALKRINLDSIYKRYGMPNDMLVKLNIHDFKVRDISVKPVYNQGEKSNIKLWRVIPTISWLLTKGFFRRMFEKYIIRDFHPLVFFYLFGILFFLVGSGLGIFTVIVDQLRLFDIGYGWMIMGGMLFMSGIQLILFAMWFDMDNNKDLKG